jgi:hypothetical protein
MRSQPRSHPEMAVSEFALSALRLSSGLPAISFQSLLGGTKTMKKQIIKLSIPLKRDWRLTAPSRNDRFLDGH